MCNKINSKENKKKLKRDPEKKTTILCYSKLKFYDSAQWYCRPFPNYHGHTAVYKNSVI